MTHDTVSYTHLDVYKRQKIQSLPIIGREWEYQFYVEVAFNDYLRYKQSIAAITPLPKELKILGEYAEGKSNV